MTSAGRASLCIRDGPWSHPIVRKPPRALHAVVLAAWLAGLSPSCRSAPAPRAELHCFQTDAASRHNREGLNPLLGAFVGCFRDAPACEARAKAEATECSAIVPRWHCFSVPGARPANDPLDGLTFCYPSRALCDAARTPHLAPSVALSDEAPPRPPCKAAETVYCQATEPLLCSDSEALCNQAADMAAEVLHERQTHPRCVPRHSVR